MGRFATVSTGEIGPADDVSSTGTHDAVRSTTSITQGAPGSAQPMQDENMASLHVKFSASTRFNNSDQDTLRDHIQRLRATGGAQHPSGIPRSGASRLSSGGSGPRSNSPPLSRRSTNNLAGASPPSDGSPMNNIMRALTGRHRRSTSTDTTVVRRTSSSGQRSFVPRSNSPPAARMPSLGSSSSGRLSPSGPIATYSTGPYRDDGASGSDTGRRSRQRHRLGRWSQSGGEDSSDGAAGWGGRGRGPQRSMSRQRSARRGGLFGSSASPDDGGPGAGEERTSVGRSFSFMARSMRRSQSSGRDSEQGTRRSRRSRGGSGDGGGGFAALLRGQSRSRSRGGAGEDRAGGQPTRRSEARRRRGDSSGGGFFSALTGGRARARRSAAGDGTGGTDLSQPAGRGRGRREPSGGGGGFLRALTGRRSTAESVASAERPRRSESRSEARRRTHKQSQDGGEGDGGGGVGGFLRALTRSRSRSRGRRSTDTADAGLGNSSSTRRSRERSSGGSGFLRALTRSRSRSRGGADGSEVEGTGNLRRSRTEQRNRDAEWRSQSRSRSRDPGQSLSSAFSFGRRRSRSSVRMSEAGLEESGGMRRPHSRRGSSSGGGGLFGRRSHTSRSGRPSLAGQSSGMVMLGSPRGTQAGGGFGAELSGGGAGPSGQGPPHGYDRAASLAFRAGGMHDPNELETPTLRAPGAGMPPGGRPPLAPAQAPPALAPSGPSGSQLDAMRPPELQLETSMTRRPPPFVPRVSLTGGGPSSTAGIAPYASFGGTSSLPSPSMAQSPTFTSDRPALPAVSQPPPAARTGSPPRVPGSMRRQGSPERRPPRSASRPRRSESAPRSRAAARRAEMQAAGEGGRQPRSRSARRHDEGEPKVRMSFAAARRARKMSVGGAASGSEAAADVGSEAGMAKSGSAPQRGSLFAWLFSGRKSKHADVAAGSVASSPERSMGLPTATPGTPTAAQPAGAEGGGVGSVPGTPPAPLLGPGPISPVQGGGGFDSGSVPSYPTTPGSITRSPSATVAAAVERLGPGPTSSVPNLGAVSGAAAPDVSAHAGPRPEAGMVVDHSRRSSGLDRLRPAPLTIPSDPRLGVITAERVAAEAAAAGRQPAGGEVAPPKKGGWGKLGKMFGAIKRFTSPSKGGAAEAQPAAAGGPAQGPSVPAVSPLNISTSLLPLPAFPNMPPPAAGAAAGTTADGRTPSQASLGADAALSRYRSPSRLRVASSNTAAAGSVAAVGGVAAMAATGAQGTEGGAGAAAADGTALLKDRASLGGKGTGAASGGVRRGDGGSRADLAGVPDAMVDMDSPFMKAARILQGIGADMEAQDAGKTGKGGRGRHARGKSGGRGARPASWSPPKLRAPAFVPRGRSISPLGRGMVAEVAGAAGSPGPGRGPPVVYLAPLAAQVQGKVVISPLKPSQSVVPGPGGLGLAGHAGSAAWGVEGQGVFLGYDRLPTIVSALRPGGNNRAVSPPGHLPRPPPPHPGLPYSGPQLPPATALHSSVDGYVFPATMPLDPTLAMLDPRLGSTMASDQPLLGSLALGATGGTISRPGTAATAAAGGGGGGGAGSGRRGRLLTGAQAAFLNAQTQILQQSQLLAAAQAQAQAPWDGAVTGGGGGGGGLTGGLLRGSLEVPVGVLRSPRLLGLYEPGVGGMLLQAPDGVRSVAGAEAADWVAAAETGVLPLPRSAGLPGGQTAWGEGVGGGEVMLTTAALRPPPRLPRPGLLHLGLASGGPGEAAYGTGSWRGGFGADGVMSSAAGTLQDVGTMSRPGSAMPGPVRSESPSRLPPSAYRPHRPLGTHPPEEVAYPALRRPDQPALLTPDYPYTAYTATAAAGEDGAPLLPLPPMPPGTAGMRTGGVLQPRAGTQPGAATPSWRPGTAGGAGLPPGLTGGGGGRGEDDDSSIASSETANSLRDMPPALAQELRRREILDPSGVGLGLPTSAAGVTVRPLRREVTAGPHVKLMKPKQLLRQLEPPGPEPTFTRRQQWTLTERHGDQDTAAADAPSGGGVGDAGQAAAEPATATGADYANQPVPDDGVVEPVSDEDGAAPPVASRRPSQRPRASAPHSTAPGEASPGPVRQRSQSSRHSRRRQDQSPSPQPRHEAGRDAQSLPPGLAPPSEAGGWARPGGAAPFIRVDTAATLVRPLAPPPMPAAGRSPPRLLRVPQPPAAYQQTRRHVNFAFGSGDGAEEPRFNNVRLMRVVNPPAREAEPRPGERAPEQLPSRKLRVLDRPEAEIPGVVPAGTAGRTEHLLGMLRRPEARRPATGIGHRVGLFDQPPGFGTPGSSPNGGGASASQTPPGRSPRDAATQSGPASPAIEIRVNTGEHQPRPPASTSPAHPAASPRQQLDGGGYPPYLPYPPYPGAPPPPPQIVLAPTDPAALAGLAALQQLTALSALSGLGQAVGAPPVDDPTLWPDLMETTPESLQETAGAAAARWRQQRALSQPNISAAQLRDMDPSLVLEPPQMLGPGPLGDAQHVLRSTGVAGGGPTVVNLPTGPGAGFGAGGGYGSGFGTGGPGSGAAAGGRGGAAVYGAAGASPRDGYEGRGSPGSPGRWLLSRSADGQVLAVGVAAHESGRVPGRRSPGEVVVYGGYQTQHLKSDLEPEPSAVSLRERERRRRRGLPEPEEVEDDEEGGLGREQEEKGVVPRRSGRSGRKTSKGKGREKKDKDKGRRGSKHHRRRKGRDAADSGSDSDSSTDRSSTSSRSDSESSTSSSSSSSSSSDGRRRQRQKKKKKDRKREDRKKRDRNSKEAAAATGAEKVPEAAATAADTAGKQESRVVSRQGSVADSSSGKPASAKGAGLPPLGPGRTASSASLPPIPGGASAAGAAPADAASADAAAAPRPDPGDDFGMGLAEKLLRQMEEPIKRSGQAGSKGGSKAGSVKGGEASQGGQEEGQQQQQQQQHGPPPNEHDSDELVSPPAGRLARVFAPTSPGSVDQRESNSPNAKMVDVLHGPDTERRTQEILDQHAALRAKFIVAADNLRSQVLAAGLPQSQLALGAGASQPAGEQQQQQQQQDQPTAEATLTVVPGGEQQPQAPGAAREGSASGTVARQDSRASARAPGSAKGSDGGASGNTVSTSAHSLSAQDAAGAGQAPSGPPGSQSINIYCTQLVLNPGSGPVTVPGLPAYYPAPGPAAWGGVPVAQPVMPPPGMPADWEPTADRAGYVRHSPYHPGHPRVYPPAVHVSPTATAAWLPQPPGRAGAAAAGGGPRSTGGGGGPPPDRSHSHVHFTDVPPSVSAYSPPEHKSGDSADSSPDGLSEPGGRLRGGGGSQVSLAARSQGGASFTLRPEASGVSQSSRQPPIARVVSRGSSIARAWGAGLGGPEPSGGSMQRLTEERLAGLAVGSSGGGAPGGGGGGRRQRSSAASGPMSVEEEAVAVGSERGEPVEVEAVEGGRVPSAEPSSRAAAERAASGSGEVSTAAAAAGEGSSNSPRGSGGGSQASGGAAAASIAGTATATGSSTQQQPTDTKTQLASELTQLIMQAFQESGGVITAHREGGGDGVNTRTGGGEGKADKAVGTSVAGGSSRTGPRGPASAASGRSGSLGGFEATLTAPPSAEPTAPPQHPQPQPPPMRLPATLPNAAVPRGSGPSFLQVRDIALAADAPPGPSQFTPDPAADKLTADILGGLNNWEETVMSALMGRPPPQPPLDLQPQPGGAAATRTVTLYDMPVVMQGQYHSPGPAGASPGASAGAGAGYPAYLIAGQAPDPGRDLTAAEALVLEPGYAAQHALAGIAARKQQRAAAVAERRARYAVGMGAFVDEHHQPQPLHMPPPQHPWPPSGGQDYRLVPGPAPSITAAATGGYGIAANAATLNAWAAAGAPTFAGGGGGGAAAAGIQRRYGGGGGAAVAGGRGSPLALEEDTHGTLFPASQSAYTGGGLAGPGVVRQPHPRSPLQRVMHGEADPRKKRRAWEVPSIEQQRAAPLWEHQATFRTNVRTAMRSSGRRERTSRPGGSPGRDDAYYSAYGSPGRADVGVGPPTVSFADGTRGGYSPQEGDARVPYMARTSHPATASPATAAVRSLAAMVARRFEGGEWETRQLQKLGEGGGRGQQEGWEEDPEGAWPGDTDVLGDGNVCGGCDFPGCPVHGDPGAAAAAEEERQSRRRPPGAQPGGPDAQAYTEQELTKRAHREMARSVMLDQWMAEMKQLSAATAKAEATRKVAIASAQQAVANRRERQAAELAGIFDMLTEVDALANNISDQASETKKMMQALEEEAELRRVSRLNSLLHEARRLGSAVDTALGPEAKVEATAGAGASAAGRGSGQGVEDGGGGST
ncbi:hypothetical protein HYH02_014310 [Chlamydomonas schloesseri]|uniref:Uncharacterized protein n=1 Tax=Chlamydomonas schloesseri TaxID=2026947 RepID=A0A835VWM7_9CHLO|nr:hypothetical protein HYH02_014310 [Chlamydomonas schloesseri]|eukprot:KAG2428608.1 hypothetical protein HYH02_014310 [Chlamydomonas schloesseri]